MLVTDPELVHAANGITQVGTTFPTPGLWARAQVTVRGVLSNESWFGLNDGLWDGVDTSVDLIMKGSGRGRTHVVGFGQESSRLSVIPCVASKTMVGASDVNGNARTRNSTRCCGAEKR